MKKTVFAIFFFFCLNLGFAQDQLFKKDNTKLLVKIYEISSSEIKYKNFDHLNGPMYVLKASEVALIIYENGKHEVINVEPVIVYQKTQKPRPITKSEKFKRDSIHYFRYTNSISLNVFNFLNTEIGLIYQKEFFKKNLNLIVPLAVGFGEATYNESAYFIQYGNSYLNLDRKVFEIGLGLNYYASLTRRVNFYIGPAIRYMQYDVTQLLYYNASTVYGIYSMQTIQEKGTMTRYTATINNGLMIRTKSRIVLNAFLSPGIKYDAVSTKIVNPVTQVEEVVNGKPMQFFVWAGACVGFCF